MPEIVDDCDNPRVPVNGPAISDLFDLFNFNQSGWGGYGNGNGNQISFGNGNGSSNGSGGR